MKLSSKRKLILITGYYPYSLKETFLETEILYLAEAFDDVVIAPRDAIGQHRPVPSGVTIDHSYSKYYKKNGKVASLFSKWFIKGIFIHWRYICSTIALRRINSFVYDALATYRWLKDTDIGQPALIYTYWLNGKTFGALLYSRLHPNTKVVSRGHRYDIYDYWFDPAFWPFREKTLRMLDRLFLISNDGMKYLSEKYPDSRHKYKVAKLGVTDRGVLSKRSGDGVFRIVSVSSLLPVKRVSRLVDYLLKFATDNPSLSIAWTHMGDGPENTHIINQLKDNRPENFNHQFKGQVTNTDVLNFYRDNPIDVFINVSSSEGIPVSIMEAQACGIPCIATDVGGTSEIVVTGETGVLLTSNPTYDELAGILLDFIDGSININPDQVRSFWTNNYNAEINYSNFTSDLKEVQ